LCPDQGKISALNSGRPAHLPGDPFAGIYHGTNPARAGEHNEHIVLQAIRHAGECTRLQLAELTGLSAAAIANITQRLTDRGYILAGGRRTGVRGMPAIRFTVNPDGCFTLGVNIDRDHLSVVALDLTGAARARYTEETNFASPGTVVAYVRDRLDTLLGQRLIDPARILGLGVALPGGLGRVDVPGRPAEYAVWDDVDVPALFGSLGPWPVLVENDAAAAAIGEARYGVGLVHRSFFYILLSAGLGGGLVVAGRYHHGATGRAARVGFLDDGNGRPLQSIVSLSALKGELAHHGVAIDSPADLAAPEPHVLALIRGWIDRAADALAKPIATINCLIDPGAIVIGGRLPLPLIDELAAAIGRRVTGGDDQIIPSAPVVTAQLASDAPALGAAILPFNKGLFLPER
jgi:predicted NBD/HSP70 family sugar kinase